MDKDSIAKPAEVENYNSAIHHRSAVEKQIITEIQEGRYVITDTKPTIISALGAIPKSDGSVRLIHDCSQPAGLSVNEYANDNISVKYQSLSDAVNLLSPGCYLAKLDLKSAYRSVALHPSQYMFTGLKWKFASHANFTYMYDTALPFGARKSPGIFHKLSQAVRKMMEEKGHKVVAYLDDFLIVADSKQQCQFGLSTLIKLLRDLGFSIAWHKVEGPTQQLTFLGIHINTINYSLQLPLEKVAKLQQLLIAFKHRSRA